MNILLAFKAEPDAGMLAEKEWQAAQGNSGTDASLLRSLLGADEQAAAALLLAQRKNGTPMSLTALSMGDERALHWLRYLMALGFEEAVLLETAADLRFCAGICRSPYCRMAVPESAGSDNYWLPKQRRAEWANAIFAGGNAGLALLHPGGALYSRRAVYHPRTAY